MNISPNISEENDDRIPERCWKEKRRGHSKFWLMTDGSNEESRGMICSSMKESYLVPEHDERPLIGKRRMLFKEKMTEEVAQKIIQENNEPPPVEEYCTEYDGNFHYPGYDPDKKIERDTELYLKWPLYGSQPTTCHKFQIDNQPRGEKSIRGLTAVMDVKSPFKKCAQFSRRMSEVLDADML